MMPPKKTQTVAAAYIAKCTKCLKKHSPPLNDDCLALVHPDLAKLSDIPDDDENDPEKQDDLDLDPGEVQEAADVRGGRCLEH
jgi:hypothetical protein